MGANQSGRIGDETSGVHGITVVTPTPGQEVNEERVILPNRVSPILSIQGHLIDPNKHKPEFQLDQQPWIEFAATIDTFTNSRAELVATRQSQLQERIMQVDDHVQGFTDCYINDKHKALARLNDDCRKLEDINKLLEKCTMQSEICVDMLDKLNFLLPSDHKLEPLET